MLSLQAQKYAALKKPYLINDMVMQDVLLDRRRVYAKLKVSLSKDRPALTPGTQGPLLGSAHLHARSTQEPQMLVSKCDP